MECEVKECTDVKVSTEQKSITNSVLKENKMDGIDPGLATLLKQNGFDGKDGRQWDNPLFWLIILGFLRGGGAGGIFGGGGGEGVAAGATQAKLDCLRQGQQDAAMAAHNATMTSMFHTNEIAAQNNFNRIAGQLAECCCNLRSGQKDIVNELAKCCCTLQAGQKDIVNELCLQTQTLITAGTSNTQRIIDNANAHASAEVAEKLSDCKTALSNAEQTKELLKVIQDSCSNDGHSHRSGGGGK